MAVQWGPSCSVRADGGAKGHDKANSRFFVILRNVPKKTHSRLYSLHSKPISRKLQSTDETSFRSLINHTGRIWAGRSGVRFTETARDMSLPENVQTACGAKPAFHSVGKRRYPIPGVERPRREADHLPPFIADVKNK